MPSSSEAEEIVLGTLVLEPQKANEIFAVIKPGDFYSPRNRAIAGVIYGLLRTGRAIDPVFIIESLKLHGNALDITITEIANLTRGLLHNQDIQGYIALIKSKSLARTGINCATDLMKKLQAGDTLPEDVISEAVATFIDLQINSVNEKTHSMADATAHVKELFDEWATGNTGISSVKTGIPELDGKLRLGGWAYGELALIAARPSFGKTGLVLQFIVHAARMGVPVLMVSLEMTRNSLVTRMLPAMTGIPNKSINPQTLQKLPEQGAKLHKALDELHSLPIHFDRSDQLPQMIATAEHYVQSKGVKLIAFDYLTLFKVTSVRSNENRAVEVGNITKEIKSLAVRTNTALVGIAQLNRESEKENRRPRKSDLRDSGEVEQAVDVLLFPWDSDAKAHVQNPDSVKDRMWLDLYCDKQRDGESGWTVPLLYDKNMQTFTSSQMNGERPPRKVKPVQPVPNGVPARNFYEKDEEVDL